MFRTIVYLGVLLVLFLLLVVMMLSAGWIKILVDGREITDDFKHVGNGIVPRQQFETQVRNSFDENRLFRVEFHVVSPGETLFDLERTYGTNWKVIQRINKIEDPLRLNVGTIIWVPVKIADS